VRSRSARDWACDAARRRRPCRRHHLLHDSEPRPWRRLLAGETVLAGESAPRKPAGRRRRGRGRAGNLRPDRREKPRRQLRDPPPRGRWPAAAGGPHRIWGLPDSRSVSSPTVSDLEIRHSGAGVGSSGLSIGAEAGTALAERLVAKAQGVGCIVGEGALVRDTVCQGVNDTAGADGLLMLGALAPNKGTATINNVTAIGASTLGEAEYGIQVLASGGAEQILLGNNVIAIGGDGDVRVATSSDPSSLAGALLANSNFSTVSSTGPGTEIPATPGEAGNQTAEPQLVDPFPLADPFSSDLHQLAGSPTVDAGGPGAHVSSTDIDGEPRCMGAGLDIGADELTDVPCSTGTATPGGDSVPTRSSAAPRCRGRAATIVARPRRKTNGTRRRDVIVGTRGRDVIRARGGRATWSAVGAANDLILGGPGPDALYGEGGRDTLRGQAGADLLVGAPGARPALRRPGTRQAAGQGGPAAAVALRCALFPCHHREKVCSGSTRPWPARPRFAPEPSRRSAPRPRHRPAPCRPRRTRLRGSSAPVCRPAASG
jgi:RTX calcium-binding nonapeptide repeat (4 copies)